VNETENNSGELTDKYHAQFTVTLLLIGSLLIGSQRQLDRRSDMKAVYF